MTATEVRLAFAVWTLADHEGFGLYVHEMLVFGVRAPEDVVDVDGVQEEIAVNSDTKVNGYVIVKLNGAVYMLTFQDLTVRSAIELEEGLITCQEADIIWRDDVIVAMIVDSKTYEATESRNFEESQMMPFLNIED